MKKVFPANIWLPLAILFAPTPALSADPQLEPIPEQAPFAPSTGHGPVTVRGRAAVLDGRTLWFPDRAMKVRLAGIDSCELPQWAYDPAQHGERPVPKPVPCGPLAKAWLKRSVGDRQVVCRLLPQAGSDTRAGICSLRGRDLALEMLRVGWARVNTSYAIDPGYVAWQRHAMSARYGMWATYVLDMDEWRRKAIDKTLSRRPIADFNLLAEREREISPPFQGARKRPSRTDR